METIVTVVRPWFPVIFRTICCDTFTNQIIFPRASTRLSKKKSKKKIATFFGKIVTFFGKIVMKNSVDIRKRNFGDFGIRASFICMEYGISNPLYPPHSSTLIAGRCDECGNSHYAKTVSLSRYTLKYTHALFFPIVKLFCFRVVRQHHSSANIREKGVISVAFRLLFFSCSKLWRIIIGGFGREISKMTKYFLIPNYDYLILK